MMFRDLLIPFLATGVFAAAVLLFVGWYLLATLDEYDAPVYEPPPRPAPGQYVSTEPAPPYVPRPRPTLIVDGHLGVFEVGSPLVTAEPLYDRLRVRYAVAQVPTVPTTRELVAV